MALPTEYIRQPRQFESAVEDIQSAAEIAGDTEANSRHAYPEELCLVQIATPAKIYIIDPILLERIELLRGVFANQKIVKVFHTAEYDIRSLNRHRGFETKNVFDVAVAAQFMGLAKFGLANVLQELLHIDVKKSRKIQEGDWRRRPLSREEIEYAADDVRYLLRLKEYMEPRLAELGRSGWVREECELLERLRYEPRDEEKAFLRVKFARRLDGRGLAVLKSLFAFREKEALRRNKPPQYLLPDITLTHLADNPDAELSTVPELNERRRQQYEHGIASALNEGMNGEPIVLPDNGNGYTPMSKETKRRYQLLREWRETTAASLALDPSLIWPRQSLERLAENPALLSSEPVSGEVRQWQMAEFGDALGEVLRGNGRQ